MAFESEFKVQTVGSGKILVFPQKRPVGGRLQIDVASFTIADMGQVSIDPTPQDTRLLFCPELSAS